MRQSLSVTGGWEFTQIPSKAIPKATEEWHPCSIPTSVHVELIKLNKIPHPFRGLAEWNVQWVGEADWQFRTTFQYALGKHADQVDLVCDGLDTYCDVTLNGKTLGSTENMFLSHRFPCRELLLEGENELVLVFRSAWYEAKKAEAENGGPMALWNGDSSRLYSRKAQYGWGWDWGPILLTAGPWKPIRLEAYSSRIDGVRVDAKLTGNDYQTASLAASVTIARSTKGLVVHAQLETASGDVVKEATLKAEDGEWKWDFEAGEVDAWWPIGYGKQPLYSLKVDLVDANGTMIDRSTHRVAFRNAKVIQEPLEGQPGTSFLFEVNGVRVFCGGSNWIPADSFLTEIEPDRYRKWVDLMIRGNQNMLRVWGGGVYEADELYDICDEKGILVWQDFMFGCGLYPSYDHLNASVKLEAEQAVKRLRDHPSVVIFAGNNEDYQVAESLGVMDYSDNSGHYMKTKFPARQIYEVILPEVVERLSGIFYHRSSPYGGESSSDRTVGDIHQWNVWHGTQEPWSNWDILAGRFVSEFGMQGYPNKRTVQAWQDDGDDSQYFPQSRVSANHNKADGFERRLELYLMENFRHAFDMDNYIFYTQIMQAETLAAAYRLWRRNWKGRGKEYTSGALVWQINDCWPCVSWAIADYYTRPKPAFFSIARELRPYTVGMARKEVKKPRDNVTSAFFEITHEIELWACNSTLQSKSATIELVSWELHKGEVDRRTFDVNMAPNASTEVWKGTVPGQPVRTSQADVPRPIVVQARLLDDQGEVLARYSNWPEPWKYLIFPKYDLKITEGSDSVTLSTNEPIKGIVLDVEGDDCDWDDQAIDLFPGDDQVIGVRGLGGRKVVAKYLGDGSA